MASITMSVSDKFKAALKAFSWVNWSEIAREEALKEMQLAKEYKEFKRIVSKSRLTEEDALKLAKDVNKSLHERYKRLYPKLL